MGLWIQSWLENCSLRELMASSLAFPSRSVYILIVVNIFSNDVTKDHGDILIILFMTPI